MADHVPSILTSRLAKLNPFGKDGADDENLGEVTGPSTIAGGGHAAFRTALTKTQLRVSQALQDFLIHHQALAAGLEDAELAAASRALMDKAHINVPASVIDRSHPLPEYFVSSSHNTYLLAHQLYGSSSTTAYGLAIGTGARCVEIDAWDNEEHPDEPKVTHGYTLASNIPFRAVCEAIRDAVDHEGTTTEHGQPSPVLISLENHCGTRGQLRLAQIMKEVWQHRLLSERVRQQGQQEQQGSGEHVTLDQLGAKIAVIVEFHVGEVLSESSSSEEENAAKADSKAYKQRKKDAVDACVIIPELAELGVYAQSIKPIDKSWLEGELSHPHHHLINISESGLSSLMPASNPKIAKHNSEHLMRVFPKGTRISSANLNPAIYWGVGAQVCALNWQTFDASMQLNEALFAGTDGFVLKPAALRRGGSGQLNTGRQRQLRLHVAGATDVPVPEGHNAGDIRPYLTCSLIHPSDVEGKPAKRKTSAYKQHKLGLVHKGAASPGTDPVWDETLEWQYEDNELTFLRLIIKSDDKFAKNPMFAVASVRLLYVVKGWTFIRMLDLKGRETHCTLLVKFDFDDA
ncbi:hypothetical protein LTR95_006433 [Oleoguttula sp. CCFEE 5521]